MTNDQNLWQEEQTSRDLQFYLAIARRPLVFSLGAILFFYFLSLISFLSWSKELLNWLSWTIIIILLLVICFRVARLKFEELAHAATAGALIGLVAGAWHAVLQTIWFPSWWMLIDLVLEPLATAIIGLLIGMAIAKLFQITHQRPGERNSGGQENKSTVEPEKQQTSEPIVVKEK